jgi:ubiquinone/menaquinone biosynthesis C-methylase UbiE
MSQVDHFDAVASRYDDLRRPGPLARYELLDRVGGLKGTRLLDIGCGTGVHLRAFQDLLGCRVSGIDPSPGMLREARTKLPDADLRPGRAEELPYGDDAFERAVMLLVVHHVDRPSAFAEARRVLEPGGCLIIQTADPAAFPSFWMAPLFPSYVDVEQRRFPAPLTLEQELLAAGFAAVRVTPHTVPRAFPRKEALERIRGRYASTFDHFSDEEYRAGLARAERELPATVEYTLEMLILRADR